MDPHKDPQNRPSDNEEDVIEAATDALEAMELQQDRPNAVQIPDGGGGKAEDATASAGNDSGIFGGAGGDSGVFGGGGTGLASAASSLAVVGQHAELGGDNFARLFDNLAFFQPLAQSNPASDHNSAVFHISSSEVSLNHSWEDIQQEFPNPATTGYRLHRREPTADYKTHQNDSLDPLFDKAQLAYIKGAWEAKSFRGFKDPIELVSSFELIKNNTLEERFNITEQRYETEQVLFYHGPIDNLDRLLRDGFDPSGGPIRLSKVVYPKFEGVLLLCRVAGVGEGDLSPGRKRYNIEDPSRVLPFCLVTMTAPDLETLRQRHQSHPASRASFLARRVASDPGEQETLRMVLSDILSRRNNNARFRRIRSYNVITFERRPSGPRRRLRNSSGHSRSAAATLNRRSRGGRRVSHDAEDLRRDAAARNAGDDDDATAAAGMISRSRSADYWSRGQQDQDMEEEEG